MIKSENDRTAAGPGRKSRDSSLYKDMAKQAQSSPKRATASKATGSKAERRTEFVLTTTSAEVVPVEHQAVIDELKATLNDLAASRTKLEAHLGSHQAANKLEIAQIKGRLAELRRKESEIETLLRSRGAADSAASAAAADPD